MNNHVTVYGAEDCEKCAKVKEVLRTEGVEFTEKPAQFLLDPSVNPDWRTNGSVNALAQLIHKGWDMRSLPVIQVGNEYHDVSNMDSVDIAGLTVSFNLQILHCESGACSLRRSEAAA